MTLKSEVAKIGEKVCEYIITKASALHARFEQIDGKEVTVVYAGTADRGKTTITMTDAEAEKYNEVLGLKPASITTVEDSGENDAEDDANGIPKNWRKMSKKKRLALASTISGNEVADIEEADAVIAAADEDKTNDAGLSDTK